MGTVSKGQLDSTVFCGHHSPPTRLQDEAVSLTDHLPLCRLYNGHNIQLTLIARPKDEAPKGGGRAVLPLLKSRPCSRFSEAANRRAPPVQTTSPLLFVQTSRRRKCSWVPANPTPAAICWQHFQRECICIGKGHILPRPGAARFQEHLCAEPRPIAPSPALGFRTS